MKGILVPLDGSPFVEGIIPLAMTLARSHGAELLLLRARRWQGFLEGEVAAREEAEAYLTRIARDVAAQHVPVRWTVCCDEPARAIADAARDHDADLVTMMTHGRGAVVPSIAEGVVQQASVPVLVARGDLAWSGGTIGRVVVPLDGSELATSILPIVAELATPFDFTIDLVRAVEPLPGSASPETAAMSYLAHVAEQLEARGLRVARSIAVGSAAQGILRHAGAVGAGLIAMSTHGRTGLGRLLLGSVAEQVLRAAPAPVLLWKAPLPAARPV